MKICIYGAGAVGGLIAARLAARGHAVSAVARGANLAAMRAGPLVLQSGEREIVGAVTASDRPEELGRQDAVLVTTKANALPGLAAGLAPLAGPDTPVAFVQNGIPWWYARGLGHGRPAPPDLSRLDPGEGLWRALAAPGGDGPSRAVGGVVYSSNEVVAPGRIRNGTPTRNILALGEIDDRPSARVRELRAAVRDAGMDAPETDDIRGFVWQKLLRNLAGSTLALLTERPLSTLKTDPALREIAKASVREGLKVAAAHGVAVDADPEQMYGPDALYPPHKPSILQDYEAGRPMEVEALIRTPQAFARAAGIATPTLDTIVALIVARARAKGLYDG